MIKTKKEKVKKQKQKTPATKQYFRAKTLIESPMSKLFSTFNATSPDSECVISQLYCSINTKCLYVYKLHDRRNVIVSLNT